MNVQKAKESHFFGKNMTLQKLISMNFNKVSGIFELRMCGSQDQCHRPLIYDDIQESRPIYAIS